MRSNASGEESPASPAITEPVDDCDPAWAQDLHIVDERTIERPNAVSHCTRVPVRKLSSPVLGWSVEAIYHLWKSKFRNPTGPPDWTQKWTAFTFIILDEQTAINRKCLLCSNAPDFGETPGEVVLKAIRMTFEKAVSDNLNVWEILHRCPSEWNDEQILELYPPSSVFVLSRMADGRPVYRTASTEEALANRRRAVQGVTKEQLWSHLGKSSDYRPKKSSS